MPIGVGLVAWKVGKHGFTHWHIPWAGYGQGIPTELALLWTRCGREIPTKGLVSWSSDFGTTVEPNQTCKVCLERTAPHLEIT